MDVSSILVLLEAWKKTWSDVNPVNSRPEGRSLIDNETVNKTHRELTCERTSS